MDGIKYAVFTEKSIRLLGNNQYTSNVESGSTRTEIKHWGELFFGVKSLGLLLGNLPLLFRLIPTDFTSFVLDGKLSAVPLAAVSHFLFGENRQSEGKARKKEKEDGIESSQDVTAHLRPPSLYVGGVPIPREAFIGGSTYHQALPYNYQHAISYPSVGYPAYGPEYSYPQNIYSPLMSQQHVQVYGVPGAANSAFYPYAQLSQPISIAQGFTTMQGYTVPGHHFMQPGGSSIDGLTASPRPANHVPCPRMISIPSKKLQVSCTFFRYLFLKRMFISLKFLVLG
ncbi:uncharacterized protein LOC110018341 [Phalaenopsis equestris]|nr:uncharacterized protein LOC110018341 [Phalaenopsis equestris]